MNIFKNDNKILLLHLASGISILLSSFVILFAYYNPDCYSVYNQYLLSQAKGQDLITLFVIVPLMIIALWASIKENEKGTLFLTGCLGYMFYTYATYSYLTYARLTLLYISIFGVSLFGLIIFFSNINYSELSGRLQNNLICKWTAIYNITVGLLIALLWIKTLATSLFTGIIPVEVSMSNNSSVIYANDLGFFLPAIILSGFLLLKKSNFGFILTAVVLVKEVMMGAAILGMIYIMYLDKQPIDLGMAMVFTVVTVLSVIVTILFYSQIVRKKLT